MNDRFGEDQDLSRIPSDVPSRMPDLSPQQREIRRNLEAIGPEIAAYYLDGIKILHSTDLETAVSLLAHIAREIDGGLRDILSSDQTRANIQQQLTEEVLTQLGDYSELKERRGHIASILEALGIDNVRLLFSPDDIRTRFAVRWVNVAIQFHKFAHRHGAWKSPRSREEFENLWYEFEGILAGLVGNYLNLLDRIDRILEYEKPTEEIRGTLPNLLESESRRAYFFRKLESPAWLEPLKEDGWFNPEQNPALMEDPEQPGYYYTPRWHAFGYVEKVANHPEIQVSLLVNIVNAIINYTNENGERTENRNTDLQIIKIIGVLPIAQLESQHIAFIGIVLKSERRFGLVDQEIGETILTKLLAGGKWELVLTLLTIMLEVESVEPDIRPVMNDYWLETALKAQAQTIANLCGIEAAQIALTQIRTLAAADTFAFHFIQLVESDVSRLLHPDYTELVISFASSLFRFAEPDSIEDTVAALLHEPHTIIRRIAVKAITDHYGDLKHLFWRWEGNPLDEIELKPEVYQLIETNSGNFNEAEMEQVLQWIESTEN